MLEKIPTTIVTGFLGVGKTTAILELMNFKPVNEKWAVLVNEFGEVAVDETVFKTKGLEDITVKAVPGGCLCCAAGLPFQVAVTRVLREVKPDRLIIEPSGLGHLDKILKQLEQGSFKTVIDLRAVICLVDPACLANEKILKSNIFKDQVQSGDIIVASKVANCSAHEMINFREWVEEQWPAKQIVNTELDGRIDPEWLDEKHNCMREKTVKEAHGSHASLMDLALEFDQAEDITEAQPMEPLKLTSSGDGYKAYGWKFFHEDIFEEFRVRQFIEDVLQGALFDKVVRGKGLFKTNEGALLINFNGRELTEEFLGVSEDSRFELIVEDGHDFNSDAIEKHLIQCLL